MSPTANISDLLKLLIEQDHEILICHAHGVTFIFVMSIGKAYSTIYLVQKD